MTIKGEIRLLIERLTHLHIYRVLPRGVDVLYDIKMLLPRYIPHVIFDVGANVGQSSRQYVDWFPQSQIYCFEPISSNFIELQRNIKSFSNVHSFQLALGSSKGRLDMCGAVHSSMYSLYPIDDMFHTNSIIESVEIDTIDKFCHKQEINKIGFLKIDTEGHDFEVLKGAEGMLSKQSIDIVQVEAGMTPKIKKFVAFEEFKAHLENRGYFLFGIYDQVHEHYTNKSYLRRSNPVFISERVIDINIGG